MLIKNARHAAAVLALVIFAIPAAQAQGTATQNVEYSVASIQKIALSGAPALDIITADAGSAPTSVTDATASYAITTNTTGCKITASLGANMGTGLTLSAILVAPTAATSAGKLSLSKTAADMVTGITKLNAPILGITYSLDATSAAGVVASATAVVSNTVTPGTRSDTPDLSVPRAPAAGAARNPLEQIHKTVTLTTTCCNRDLHRMVM